MIGTKGFGTNDFAQYYRYTDTATECACNCIIFYDYNYNGTHICTIIIQEIQLVTLDMDCIPPGKVRIYGTYIIHIVLQF